MSPKDLDEYLEVIFCWAVVVLALLWIFGAFE